MAFKESEREREKTLSALNELKSARLATLILRDLNTRIGWLKAEARLAPVKDCQHTKHQLP